MTAQDTPLLPNFLAGRWQTGTGHGTALLDPVTGEALVRVDNTGLELGRRFCLRPRAPAVPRCAH